MLTAPFHTESMDRLIVYYDGSCPACLREIRFYQARNTADMVWIDVSRTHDLGDDLTQAQALARFHVRLADGTLKSGPRAFLEVWDRLPLFRRISPVLRPLTPILDLGYAVLLKARPYLPRAFRSCANGACGVSSNANRRVG